MFMLYFAQLLFSLEIIIKEVIMVNRFFSFKTSEKIKHKIKKIDPISLKPSAIKKLKKELLIKYELSIYLPAGPLLAKTNKTLLSTRDLILIDKNLYVVQDKIGAGANGTVYSLYDPIQGEAWVVKLIWKKPNEPQENFKQRINHEYTMLKKSSEKQLAPKLPIYTENFAALVMKNAGDYTLEEFLKFKLTIEQKHQLAVLVIKAFIELLQNNIFYYDFNTNNIIINFDPDTQDFTVTFIDFERAVLQDELPLNIELNYFLGTYDTTPAEVLSTYIDPQILSRLHEYQPELGNIPLNKTYNPSIMAQIHAFGLSKILAFIYDGKLVPFPKELEKMPEDAKKESLALLFYYTNAKLRPIYDLFSATSNEEISAKYKTLIYFALLNLQAEIAYLQELISFISAMQLQKSLKEQAIYKQFKQPIKKIEVNQCLPKKPNKKEIQAWFTAIKVARAENFSTDEGEISIIFTSQQEMMHNFSGIDKEIKNLNNSLTW